MASVAEFIGMAAIIGAVAAGVVVRDAIARSFGARSEEYKIDDSIIPISAVFVPVFFVWMGLKVDLLSFTSRKVLLFAGALSVVAVASKHLCSLGLPDKGLNRGAIGGGMIPRGEVGLIFASIGSAETVAGQPGVDECPVQQGIETRQLQSFGRSPMTAQARKPSMSRSAPSSPSTASL